MDAHSVGAHFPIFSSRLSVSFSHTFSFFSLRFRPRFFPMMVKFRTLLEFHSTTLRRLWRKPAFMRFRVKRATIAPSLRELCCSRIPRQEAHRNEASMLILPSVVDRKQPSFRMLQA